MYRDIDKEYRLLEARRNLRKNIFVSESVKTLHGIDKLENLKGRFSSYTYAERLLDYICENKTCLGYLEIERMFYLMVAYSYADIRRDELISRVRCLYWMAVCDIAGDAGEKIEKDMTAFRDIFSVSYDDVGQHDIYDWFDNLCHLLIIVRKMCDCIVNEYEGV